MILNNSFGLAKNIFAVRTCFSLHSKFVFMAFHNALRDRRTFEAFLMYISVFSHKGFQLGKSIFLNFHNAKA